ncbi:MAG: tRNA (adenosine(37)-N6)-threonylcarbamoyltransferase complex transferase subunit TsaD [Patescibacteria group bacterium]
MKILSIETSCDETAISIISAEGGVESPRFEVLGNALYSQAKTHAEYGGVFPALAKREHARNILPLLKIVLDVAQKNGLEFHTTKPNAGKNIMLKNILEREGNLADQFVEFCETQFIPKIDAIAVTNGPGLEPALWVGINFAKALNLAWDVPIVPVNHMEGHIISVLLSDSSTPVIFPALALLISGGHTELVEIDEWNAYKVIGRTRDDAVGEAFDKVARLLGLPYPGGPHVSRLAAEYRATYPDYKNTPAERPFILPRPMIDSPDFDFSFSGIKTSVLYTIKKTTNEGAISLTENQKQAMAAEFEDAVTDVLVKKAAKAIEQIGAETFIIGGGVVANTYIRAAFENLISKRFPHISLRVPSIDLSTDNSIMIAAAGYLQFLKKSKGIEKEWTTDFKADGNLSL